LKKQYEAMFLFDPGFATDFANAEKEIRRIMDRAEAEIVLCRRWDERKLAYEVEGRKRGVYVLTYFLAEPSRIRGIERDVQLSESVLRALVLQAEGLTREHMEQFMPSERRMEGHPDADDGERPARRARTTVAVANGDEGPAPDDRGEAETDNG
jgi:small subunit ribosomal protein S6